MALTVLMSTYNCSKYIGDAIRSILNQTFKDFEFLIIDDGSTDNTEEEVLKFNDSRIWYIKKQNTGLSDTLNYGLKIASHDIIARMDADDIAHPQRLEIQFNFLNSNPKVDVLSSWYAIFYKKDIKYLVKTPTKHEEIVKGLLLYSYISHPGCMYNRKVILKNGGYVETVFEDYELWLRIMKGVQFEIIPEVLIFQRYRKNSLSRGNISEKNKIHYQIQKKYFDSLNSYFNKSSKNDEYSVRGWREYFYGSKTEARKYWKHKFLFLINWKILLAFLLTFLPDRLFLYLKGLRIRFRLEYVLSYFKRENQSVRINLKAQLD